MPGSRAEWPSGELQTQLRWRPGSQAPECKELTAEAPCVSMCLGAAPGVPRGQGILTWVPLCTVQTLLGSQLHRPAPLHEKLLAQGMAEPAQRVGDGTALGATQALGAAEEVALWKDKDHCDTGLVDTSCGQQEAVRKWWRQVREGWPAGGLGPSTPASRHPHRNQGDGSRGTCQAQ